MLSLIHRMANPNTCKASRVRSARILVAISAASLAFATVASPASAEIIEGNGSGMSCGWVGADLVRHSYRDGTVISGPNGSIKCVNGQWEVVPRVGAIIVTSGSAPLALR